MIDVAVLAAVYAVFFYRKWAAGGTKKLFLNTVMYIYLSFVLYFTLMPIIANIPNIRLHGAWRGINMIPFVDYRAGRRGALRQLRLNVLLMMPFGFLLPQVRKCGLPRVFIYTAALSLIIELIQPLFFRAFDITDIITNTIGGIAGYAVYFILRPLIDKIMSRMK